MQSIRSSKRVAGLDVNKELPTKRSIRATAPSQKALDQLKPLTYTKPKRRRATKKAANLRITPLRGSTPCPIPQPPDQPLFVVNRGVLKSSSPLNYTLFTNPPKGPTRLTFDPTVKQVAHSQLVLIQLKWFVNNKKQNTVLKTQDINDWFRINSTWWKLKALVLIKVNYWADKRGLKGSNKPVPIEWLAIIGTLSKTSSPIRVKDQVI
jgi:hypothetical protein